ncbi:MAG: hypothetical protein GXO68_05670 [Crenarchaeota archaeon]|nr:hypothetical protein [Thermoproteota archaeon]
MVEEKAQVVLKEEEEIEIEEETMQKPAIEVEETDHIWLVSEGDELDAVVTKITHGKMKHLLPSRLFEDERWKERMERIADRYGIKVCFKIENLGVEDCDVILYSFHENARYPKIAARYKEFYKGQKIKVKANNKGRFKIV